MFKEGNRVHIWEINEPEKKKAKYMDCKISSSAKDQDDEWYTDFSAYARFIGDAKKKLDEVCEGDVIILTSVGVTNSYDKRKKKTYTNYLVFDFDLPDEDEDEEEKPKKKSKKTSSSRSRKVKDDEDLPF